MSALATPISSLAALNVLLVDDDPFTIDLLHTILKWSGIERVATATDGERAVLAFDRAILAPDVLICDLAMPGMDGLQVMEHIAASGFSGAVIVLSAQSLAELPPRFHRLNIIGVVAKPVSRLAIDTALAKLTYVSC